MRLFWQISCWLLGGVLGSFLIGFVFLAAIAEQVPVSLSMRTLSTSYWDSGYVSATGTWTISDVVSGFPLQTSHIVCQRQTKECVESQAVVYQRHLNVSQFTRKITQWTEKTIEFVDSAQCVDLVYTFERFGEKLTGTRKTKEGVADCNHLDKRNLNLVLSDGFEIAQRLRGAARASYSDRTLIALGVLWLFIAYRIWRIFLNRRSA